MADLSSDIKRLLEAYVNERRERDREENGWRGDMLKHLIKVESSAKKAADEVVRVGTKVDQLSERVGKIEAQLTLADHRISSLEDQEEVTGVHNREQMLAKLKDTRLEARWWKRLFIAAAVTMFLGAVSGGTALLVQQLTRPSSASPAQLGK